MLSLGMVPKGQEKMLQFVNRPSDTQQSSAPAEKNLEQKLKELNRPSNYSKQVQFADQDKKDEKNKVKDIRFENEEK